MNSKDVKYFLAKFFLKISQQDDYRATSDL